MIIQLQIYHCDGAIYRGGRFVTKGWHFAHFGVQFIKSYYFYDMYGSLFKHPGSAVQTLYAGNRSTQKWPVMWKLSCIDIIMAGPVKLETSGYLERSVFQNERPYCHMGWQYIWKKGQQSRIMAVIFVDLQRFLISVRAKVHETFTVYTVVAFTHWPRVAVKSTLLW